jgi:hypothetical protein
MTDSQPSRLLQRLISSLLATAADLPARLAESIRQRVPSYGEPSRVTDQELLDSCTTHVGFISSLGVPDPDRDKAVQMIGASRARSNVPLPEVLDAIRVGSEFIWSVIVDYGRVSGSASDAQLVTVAGQVWSVSDDVVRLMTAGYREEEDLRLINDERERYALIDTVLSGLDQSNATLWQAVDRLGLPRDLPYVVVAVEAQGGVVPTPRIDQRLLEDEIESVSLQQYGVRAGISPLTEDLGRIAQEVRLARTSLAASADAHVTFFSDAAVSTMAAGAPDVASELAVVVLSRVLELPELERETILDTVRIWFSTGGSVAETARATFVHSNTVRNRLRRLETLTLRSLTDPRDAAELYLAVVSLPLRTLRSIDTKGG